MGYIALNHPIILRYLSLAADSDGPFTR